MLSLLGVWLATCQQRRSARHTAWRHLVVVAHALYTGSTSAYTLTPDLPRSDNSTEVQW